MKSLRTLHILNKKFSIEQLEIELAKCLPGKYHIVWHAGNAIYDIKLKWTGKEYTDLF